MSELARGTVHDRPWGRTLGALALQHGVTGTLVLGADGKRYQIAFSQGIVVGAHSPVGSDSAVRVALTAGLVSSTQVNDITRRVQAAPQRDEVEVIAEALRLGPDHTQRLRRRTAAQRAARTFAIERGDWVLDSDMLIPIVAGSELDIRSVIYIGARQNLSEARLATELTLFGAWFRLLPDVMPDLPQFGFGELEQPVIECLVTGAGLDELEFTGVDMRVVRAMVYALASCAACEIAAVAPAQPPRASPPRPSQPPPRPSQPPPRPSQPPSRPGVATDGTHRTPPPARAPQRPSETPTTRQPNAAAQPTQPAQQSRSQPPSQPQPRTQAQQPQAQPQAQEQAQARARGTDAPSRAPSRASAARRPGNPAHVAEVGQLIRQRLEVLDNGGDYYALIGVTADATTDQIRKTYFALAHKLHPDRLSALGILDERRDAQRLFAEVNTAFSILSDPARRNDYTTILRRGGSAAIRREEAQAEETALRAIEAEEAFRRGEQALRRDQLPQALAEFKRAMELDPGESDYAALFAWTQFCNASNRDAAATQTRAVLEAAIATSPRSVAPRYYLGRVERMLGRDQDALRHFKAVLRISPTHGEAASEVRVIEARLASKR